MRHGQENTVVRRLAFWCVLAAMACGLRSSWAEETPAGRSSLDAGAAPIELPGDVRAKCLQVLRDGLKSDEFWPSIHAAEALTLGGHPDEVRRHLLPQLATETDDQHRCGLARELVRAGDRSHQAILHEILAKAEDYGHVHASESSFKVYALVDGPLLRRRMATESNPVLQIMAAAALARWGSPDAFDLLREKLSDSDPAIRRTAAWVLARVGTRDDVPRLRAARQGDDDLITRAYFDHALATLGDAEGQQQLLKNLESDDPAVRTYAATFAGDAFLTSAKEQLIRQLDDEALDARIRAAQSLLVLADSVRLSSLPGLDQPFTRDVYPANDSHPRYSEGDVIALKDGTLLYALTEFVGSGSDFARARIIARTSADQGRTWSEPRVLQDNVGDLNVMSVSLERLTHDFDGPIGFFYLVKNAHNDLDVMLRISNDEARTFGEPIKVTRHAGYHVMNNDRVRLLRSGRLVAPIASTSDVRKVNHFVSQCCISDDQGKTWRLGEGQVDYAARGAMEPEVVELADGRVAMILRTQLGHIAISYSSDEGETWTKAEPWTVTAPEAPATLRTIPSTGDLLLVWNDNYREGAPHSGKRTPLSAMISSDSGKTWTHRKVLEPDPKKTYAYTSLTFDRGRVLLTYYVRDEATGKISNRFHSLPIRWFYEDATR